MFDAALFDLDGTLIDTEPRSQAAWRRLFATHGIPLDEHLLTSFAGRPGKVILAELRHLFGDGHTVADLFAEAMSYATLPVKPVPGAVELVHRLRDDGLPIGVVTSGVRDYAESELDSIGVRSLLSVLITAEDVTNSKPDPEGYLSGCQALRVAPARTVVFEDSPAGVAAAKRAGTFCVAVTTTQSASALAAADVVLPDLAGWDMRDTEAP